jgi:hypothetical protein
MKSLKGKTCAYKDGEKYCGKPAYHRVAGGGLEGYLCKEHFKTAFSARLIGVSSRKIDKDRRNQVN